MTHDFKGALEYLEGKHYNPHDMSVAFYEEIRFALKLADRLMGEPSIDVTNKAVQYMQLNSRNLAVLSFKAMRDQLLKECAE